MIDSRPHPVIKALALLVALLFAVVWASPGSAACGLDDHHGVASASVVADNAHDRHNDSRPSGLKAANCAAACAMIAEPASAGLRPPEATVSDALSSVRPGGSGTHASAPTPPPRLA